MIIYTWIAFEYFKNLNTAGNIDQDGIQMNIENDNQILISPIFEIEIIKCVT